MLLPVFAGVIVIGWLSLTSGVSAQKLSGTISGSVKFGTSGVEAVAAIPVQLITIAEDGTVATRDVTTSDGRFQFAASTDSSLTHMLRAIHGDVQYFAPEPILLSEELPSAERQITVFETTKKSPQLRIESTIVTVVALDRRDARLTLVREDLISNPIDLTYIGDSAGITLRLPVPDGVIQYEGQLVGVEGLPEFAQFALDGGRLAVLAPLKPGRTLIVTRYVVGYDREADRYRLRATVPLPTSRTELHIPSRFVGSLSSLGAATPAEDMDVNGERVLVVKLPAEARAGQSLITELIGLAGRNNPNPLTERKGALTGLCLALVTMTGSFVFIRLLVNRRSTGGTNSNGDLS